MEKIYHSLTELIGRTPLLEISHIEKKEQLKARVLVKLESFNPGGSVKDRAAFYMIEAAEKEGLLHPGSLIIEPTSGNTGIGLAWIASVKGYRLTLTMPETMSLERRNLLKALGATLVLTPGSEGMKGAIRRAEELKAAHPGAFIPGQFDNPANPEAHVQTTAEEIWNDTDGKVDFFVAGVGTGGTISGTAKGLKKYNPSVSFHISCAVVRAWAAGFAGFSNCPRMTAPGVRSRNSSAFSMAPFIPFAPSVSTNCAPMAFNRFWRSSLMVSGMVSMAL